MTLRQTHFVRPVPLVVAEHLDLLRRGPTLEEKVTRGSAEQWADLREGRVDIAVTAIDNLFAWSRSSTDFRVIAQVEQTTPLSLYAHPSFDSLASLEGCRFAVDSIDNGFSLAAASVLQREGISVEMIEVGGVRERLEALRKNSADAALLGPPFDHFANAAGLRLISSINDLLPGYPGQGLICTSDTIARHQDELSAYLQALAAAVDWSNSVQAHTGEEVLESKGFPPEAAASLWATRACTLVPSSDGLRVVEEVRRGLGRIPDAHGGIDELRSSLFDDILRRF